jgi:hypothetical protein
MTIDDLIEKARKKGTDKQFREWVQRQPSCISGQFSEYLEDGTGRCVAAHVRRARDSGTGFKAEFACVPMTHAEHLRQHQHGETAAMPYFSDSPTDSQLAKEWFDAQRVRYLRTWIEA